MKSEHAKLREQTKLREKEGSLIGGLWQWMEKRAAFTVDEIFKAKDVFVWIILIYDIRSKQGLTKLTPKDFKKFAKPLARGKPLPDDIRFEVEDELRDMTTNLIAEYRKAIDELNAEKTLEEVKNE